MDPIRIDMNVTGLPDRTKKVHLAPVLNLGYNWDGPRRSPAADDEPTVGTSAAVSSWNVKPWALLLALLLFLALAFWLGTRNGHAAEPVKSTTTTTTTETQPGSSGSGAGGAGAEDRKVDAPPPPRPSPSPEPTPEPTSPPVEEAIEPGKKFQIELPDGTKIWTDDPEILERFSRKSGKGSVGKKSHQDHTRDGHKGGQEIVDEMKSDDRGGGNGQGCRCPPGSHQNQCGPNCDRPRQVTVEPLAQVAYQPAHRRIFENRRNHLDGWRWSDDPEKIWYCRHGTPAYMPCRPCGQTGYNDRRLARVPRVGIGIGAVWHGGGGGHGDFVPRGGFNGGGPSPGGGGGGSTPGGGGFTFGGRGRN